MSSLSFIKKGKGFPIVFLHGFPMRKEVWSDFTISFENDYTIYQVDLPGFGNSPLLPTPFQIEDVAQSVLNWLKEENVGRCIIVGHSLGGYVTLAAVEKNPRQFAGMILFHSTALPDSEEKKQSRNKVLSFIDQHGVKTFTSNFIGPLFVNQTHPAIEQVRALGMEASEAAVKGYTIAMRDRTDRTAVIKNFSSPILLLGGEKDGGIAPSSLYDQGKLNANCEVKILDGTAHMGMFEKPHQAAAILQNFFSHIELPG